MKKKILIVGLAIVILLVVLMGVRSTNFIELQARKLLTIDSINNDRGNRNSPIDGFVNIGPGLYDILTTHKVPREKIEVTSRFGDCFRASWTVTHSIVMESPHSSLCIRLRYDPWLDKYHIVGYSGSIE